MPTFCWLDIISVKRFTIPKLSVPYSFNAANLSVNSSFFHLAFTNLYAIFDINCSELGQLFLWMITPSLVVIKPNIKSPGIGLQHVPSVRMHTQCHLRFWQWCCACHMVLLHEKLCNPARGVGTARNSATESQFRFMSRKQRCKPCVGGCGVERKWQFLLDVISGTSQSPRFDGGFFCLLLRWL